MGEVPQGRFDKKVVLITDVSRRFSQCLVNAFIEEGAFVVFVARDQLKIDDTIRNLADRNSQLPMTYNMVADLSFEYYQKQVVERTIAKFNKIDVLVNTETHSFPVFLCRSTADMDRVMTKNFKIAYRMTDLCLPHLQKSGGCIVNTSSIFATGNVIHPALTDPMGAAMFAASKAALDAWAKGDCERLGKLGIRINNVSLGFIKGTTEAVQNLKPEALPVLETWQERHMLPQISVGRFGVVEDVVPVYLFLANNKRAGFITGACFNVDGGSSWHSVDKLADKV